MPSDNSSYASKAANLLRNQSPFNVINIEEADMNAAARGLTRSISIINLCQGRHDSRSQDNAKGAEESSGHAECQAVVAQDPSEVISDLLDSVLGNLQK